MHRICFSIGLSVVLAIAGCTPMALTPEVANTAELPTATATIEPTPTAVEATPTWVAPLTPAANGWQADLPITISKADLAGASEDEIALRLFDAYLLHCQTADADSFNRIEAYSDVTLIEIMQSTSKMGEGLNLQFIRNVQYSVKPTSTEYSHWLAGNGEWDAQWMRGKSLFIGVRETAEAYELVILGTG